MEEEYRKFFLERDGEKIEMVQNCEGAIKISLNNIKTDNSHKPWDLKVQGTATVTLYVGKLIFEELLWLKILEVSKIITEKMMMGVLGMIIIRSQDKTDLVKADWINVDKEYVYAMFGEINNFKEIGKYEDEKRAMQVLDNIQRFIEGGTRTDSIDSYKVRSYRNRIFQMPVK